MMTATPIPRSLAMTQLADLDVSEIDELPPGRRPIITKLISARRRVEVFDHVSAAVAAGRQAYWVCPLVDPQQDDVDEVDDGLGPRFGPIDAGRFAARAASSPVRVAHAATGSVGRRQSAAGAEQQALAAATEVHQTLQAHAPQLRVGLLHGQLPAREKAAVMSAYEAGQIDVLVATTVVEVGVDVPNASVLVVDHAQRFGLAQLHQLRGRVGRGHQQSYCLLLFDELLTDAARGRLKALYETQDGFEIAARDLQLRGPGELLGARQAGLSLLRFADPTQDKELVAAARALAAEMPAQAPTAAAAIVERWNSLRADWIDA